MSYYAKNPYEKPEPPHCFYCDDIMLEEGFGNSFQWKCHNPACEDCDPQYRDEALSEEDREEDCPECFGDGSRPSSIGRVFCIACDGSGKRG